MTAPDWSFAERSANDVEQEVTQGDQFDTEDVRLQETLVREAAQNSQDARAGNAPVRLRIHVPQPDPAYLASLTGPLMPRLEAAKLDPPASAAPHAIVIEDFGTKGLMGPIDDHHSEGDFRSFFFRHGASYKSGAQNGRWGLGKLVFPMSSQVHCFFGLTRRAGEVQSLLLGEAVLRTHHLGGKKFAPHGHFGRIEGGRVLPVSDGGFIAEFSAQFGLARSDEPGLSVVVPWPTVIPNRQEMTALVARNYLWPILSGSLEVDVMGTLLNRSTVRTVSGALPDGLLDFVEDILAAEPGSLLQLPQPGLKPGGNYRHADTLLDEAQTAVARGQLASGTLTGFVIPVPLGRKSQPVTPTSSIRVFLKKASDSVKGESIYVRKDITIPDEARRFGKTDVFAAMIADKGDVAEFLADAENPAHTSWSGQAQRLKAGWSYPNQTLSFIRKAPPQLYQLLTTGVEAEVCNALLDFFWVDDPTVKAKPVTGHGGKGGRKPAKQTTGPLDPPPPPAPRKFRLEQKTGGFTILGDGGLVADALPQILRIRLGYDIENGNAVKEWDRFDFDLPVEGGPFAHEVSGASAEMAGNEIRLEVTEPDFAFMLTGFDANRDLVVEAVFVSGG